MSGLPWWALELLSRLLKPDERTAVLGDLAESESNSGRALLEVLGLALRRQLDEWRHWQPWAALLGVAGLAGFYLSQLVLNFDAGVSLQVRTYWKYGVHYRQGVSAVQDIITLLSTLLALSVWSWTSGFVLARLSRRTTWLTFAFFYAVVTTASLILLVSNGSIVYAHRPPILMMLLPFFLPSTAGKVLFLAAAGLGAMASKRKRAIHLGPAICQAIAGVSLIVLLLWTGSWYEVAKETWSSGQWHGTPWTERILPLLVMSWPLVYLLGMGRSFGRKLEITHVSA